MQFKKKKKRYIFKRRESCTTLSSSGFLQLVLISSQELKQAETGLLEPAWCHRPPIPLLPMGPHLHLQSLRFLPGSQHTMRTEIFLTLVLLLVSPLASAAESHGSTHLDCQLRNLGVSPISSKQLFWGGVSRQILTRDNPVVTQESTMLRGGLRFMGKVTEMKTELNETNCSLWTRKIVARVYSSWYLQRKVCNLLASPLKSEGRVPKDVKAEPQLLLHPLIYLDLLLLVFSYIVCRGVQCENKTWRIYFK